MVQVFIKEIQVIYKFFHNEIFCKGEQKPGIKYKIICRNHTFPLFIEGESKTKAFRLLDQLTYLASSHS